jgi:hypothetical protein
MKENEFAIQGINLASQGTTKESTNEEIEKYPFQWFKLDMGLRSAQDTQKHLYWTIRERGLASQRPPSAKTPEEADALGLTSVTYIGVRFCDEHHESYQLIKTPLGWMKDCCADALNIPRLQNTWTPPEFPPEFPELQEKIFELGLVITYNQRKAQLKSAETRKKNALRRKEQKALLAQPQPPTSKDEDMDMEYRLELEETMASINAKAESNRIAKEVALLPDVVEDDFDDGAVIKGKMQWAHNTA